MAALSTPCLVDSRRPFEFLDLVRGDKLVSARERAVYGCHGWGILVVGSAVVGGFSSLIRTWLYTELLIESSAGYFRRVKFIWRQADRDLYSVAFSILGVQLIRVGRYSLSAKDIAVKLQLSRSSPTT